MLITRNRSINVINQGVGLLVHAKQIESNGGIMASKFTEILTVKITGHLTLDGRYENEGAIEVLSDIDRIMNVDNRTKNDILAITLSYNGSRGE